MPGVVAVIGAAGRTGRHVVRLAHAAGYAVRGLVRTAEQAQAVQALGAVPVHGDLKGAWEAVLDGADAVVWCAGTGRDSTSTEIGRDALIAVARRLMGSALLVRAIYDARGRLVIQAGLEPAPSGFVGRRSSNRAAESGKAPGTTGPDHFTAREGHVPASREPETLGEMPGLEPGPPRPQRGVHTGTPHLPRAVRFLPGGADAPDVSRSAPPLRDGSLVVWLRGKESNLRHSA